MKWLLFFISLNVFAGIQDTKVLSCQYSTGKEFTVSTGSKNLEYNRVMNDIQVKVNIKNTEKPSEVDDYIIISDFKGHKITYSLKCEQVNKK